MPAIRYDLRPPLEAAILRIEEARRALGELGAGRTPTAARSAIARDLAEVGALLVGSVLGPDGRMPEPGEWVARGSGWLLMQDGTCWGMLSRCDGGWGVSSWLLRDDSPAWGDGTMTPEAAQSWALGILQKRALEIVRAVGLPGGGQ